jgi:uncharacterized protein (TIGR02996 family)
MPGERVAGSGEELALLRGLTAQLGDPVALGVYNDWLEDHDDPRGAYLRRFLAAHAGGKRLPKRPDDVSASWEELVGLGVRRRLRQRAATVGRLEPHLPALLNAGQACTRLDLLPRRRMSRVPPALSRVGGLPDLPAQAPWPMCDDRVCGGRWPMLFLVQINLADLAGTLCEGLLPAAGLLTLFFYPANEPRGLELRYTPQDVPLERARPPGPYAFHPTQIGNIRFPTDVTHPIQLTEAMRYPEWIEDLPEELGDYNLAEDERVSWVLLGARAGKQHYFASPFRRDVCSQWAPTLYFAEVPVSHLELFELSENEALHWLFGDQLHVFVDGAAARAGVFDNLTWGTI